LYADDVRELRDVARISLTREGHGIECVEDGQVALERLLAGMDDFDLLITDHHMPRMNGLQLVTRVRELPFAGKIMIFCSELNPLVGDAYRRLNVDRILYKPVFPSDLRRVLAEMFTSETSSASSPGF
jgi:CheY-like chemotaxis protein